jgi:hypothetical protein
MFESQRLTNNIKIKHKLSDSKTTNLKQATCSYNMGLKLVFQTHFGHEQN